ncbi:MAG: hypothetical protein ABFD50_19370 [Smithella sp.]
MRITVWLIWCMVLGGGLGAFGINALDTPIWFLLIDGALLIASWNAFNLIWPARPVVDESTEGE